MCWDQAVEELTNSRVECSDVFDWLFVLKTSRSTNLKKSIICLIIQSHTQNPACYPSTTKVGNTLLWGGFSYLSRNIWKKVHNFWSRRSHFSNSNHTRVGWQCFHFRRVKFEVVRVFGVLDCSTSSSWYRLRSVVTLVVAYSSTLGRCKTRDFCESLIRFCSTLMQSYPPNNPWKWEQSM